MKIIQKRKYKNKLLGGIHIDNKWVYFKNGVFSRKIYLDK